MIQIKLTDAQFRDLFNALYEAEKSLERLAVLSKGHSGAAWLLEESEKESRRYKDLRHFISENREVI